MAKASAADPVFFATPASLRRWLERNHATAAELVVGFYRKASGKPSITWPELVDEVLCFGWIDGIRRRIDEERYTIRVTPRKPRSSWSAINIGRVAELERLGRMRDAGRQAFGKRTPDPSGTYSYEQQRHAAFASAEEKRFRANRRAWTFFREQAPSYQRRATFWVVSAKRAETKARRLDALIANCAAGRGNSPMAEKVRRGNERRSG